MKKTLTCIASFVPAVGLVLGIVLMVIGVVVMETVNENIGVFIAICSLAVILIGVIMCWVDIFWFIYLTIKNPDFDSTLKIVWSLMLYMLNFFAFPVYWYMYLRKK